MSLKGGRVPVHDGGMNTIMDDTQIETIEQVRRFLAGSGAMKMAISSKTERYEWVLATLIRFEYLTLGKAERGVLLKYLQQVSGYSRAQISRMVGQYRETGKIERRYCTANGFSRKYTLEDVSLLIALDKLHGTLSGPATRKLCERAYHIFKQEEYRNLSEISVSHLYNLRHSAGYLRTRREFTKTRSTNVKIGERRKPDSHGKPGMIRIDTVHQGDLDGKKGVYHINAIDEVTQWFRVRQWPCRQAIEQTLDRVHQVAATTLQRQCSRRGQERFDHPQAVRLRSHSSEVRREDQPPLPQLPQPLSEFPPALFLSGELHGQERQRKETLSVQKHDDAL